MGYRLDNKKIELNKKNLVKIMSDSTGDIYRYKNVALKIFNEDKDNPMDFETADYLTNISTSRILLPNKLLFYNNTFKGYQFKLVNNKSNKQLIRLPKNELIGNIALIENDIRNLSNKSILLDGLNLNNCVFNGDLYFINPVDYKKLDLLSSSELEIVNRYQFHLLLTSLIVSEMRKNNIGSKLESEIRELFNIKDNIEATSSFLANILLDNNTIKQFIKKM